MHNNSCIAEARAEVAQQRSTPAWARKLVVEYKMAEEEVNTRQDFEGLSKSGKRALLFSEFEELIAPLAGVGVRKLHQLTAKAKNIKDYHKLLEDFQARAGLK